MTPGRTFDKPRAIREWDLISAVVRAAGCIKTQSFSGQPVTITFAREVCVESEPRSLIDAVGNARLETAGFCKSADNTGFSAQSGGKVVHEAETSKAHNFVNENRRGLKGVPLPFS